MPEKSHLNPVQRFILGAIHWYQVVWSPDHSHRKELYPYGYCRFTPTCSEYAAQAVRRYGAIKGLILASWRILRCNPFSKGGPDPLL